MRRTMMALLGAMVCLGAAGARAEELSKIATVDLNRIVNEVGYQRLVFMDTSDEVRAEIMKLRTTLDDMLMEGVKEQDDAKVAILQAKIQAVNNKLNIIRNAMSNRSSDYRKSLTKYISRRYSDTYAVIIDSQIARGSGQVIVWNATAIADLTDEIIRDLDRELP